MSQRTTKFALDSEDFDKAIYLDITLSYVWCEGWSKTHEEPGCDAHPEDLQFTDVMVIVDGARFHCGQPAQKAALLDKLNALLDDKAFHKRCEEKCCQQQSDDHETALAERDEARSRKWDE